MKNISNEDKLLSIKSLQSTINKLESAFTQMTQNGTNTTLVNKRLQAFQIGLAALESAWNQKTHYYTEQELGEAYNLLIGLLRSIKSSYTKSKVGSPQKTLLKRRIQALELAVQAIEDISN